MDTTKEPTRKSRKVPGGSEAKQIGQAPTSEASASKVRVEARWPGAIAVIAVVFLVAILPGRISLFPVWAPYILGILMLVPLTGAALTAGKGWWERLERTVTIVSVVVVVGGAIANLANVINAMVHRAEQVSGVQLLASSIGVWVTNVLAFALLYWQVDRGGPGSRENMENRKPDWNFPQAGAPDDAPPGWQPAFVDYLFLAYSTATAFSATDALPLTARAKLLMIFESSISLVTIVVVASRAINILGS